ALARVHRPCHAKGGVELVDGAVGRDPRAVLRNPRPADQIRLTPVAATRVDAGEPDRHRQTRLKSDATPAGSGGTRATSRFSATCSRRLMPTSAAVMPGVERTNWRARWAQVWSPGNASAMACGRRRESCPWRIDALAITAMPKRAAASIGVSRSPSTTCVADAYASCRARL